MARVACAKYRLKRIAELNGMILFNTGQRTTLSHVAQGAVPRNDYIRRSIVWDADHCIVARETTVWLI